MDVNDTIIIVYNPWIDIIENRDSLFWKDLTRIQNISSTVVATGNDTSGVSRTEINYFSGGFLFLYLIFFVSLLMYIKK